MKEAAELTCGLLARLTPLRGHRQDLPEAQVDEQLRAVREFVICTFASLTM